MTLYSRMERSFYIMSFLFVNYSIAKVQKKITFWILALATLDIKANLSLHLREPTCTPSITTQRRKGKWCGSITHLLSAERSTVSRQYHDAF